jgi:prophage regulatory protein
MTEFDRRSKPASLPTEGFVRLPLILALIPVGRSTWWAGVKSGRYPPPVKLGPRTTAWRVEDIRRLISSAVSAGTEPPLGALTSAGVR